MRWNIDARLSRLGGLQKPIGHEAPSGQGQSTVVVVLMGVSGSGKTTIGTHLSAELGWPFADADDYHSRANVEKMRNGIPLTDEDRVPWLETLRKLIEGWISAGTNAVLACSALKQAYRDRLNAGPEVRFVFLKASSELLHHRLQARAGHYMKDNMLQSQLATLEPPANAIVIDVSGTVDESVQHIREKLQLNRDHRT
jgi:gluconokinase